MTYLSHLIFDQIQLLPGLLSDQISKPLQTTKHLIRDRLQLPTACRVFLPGALLERGAARSEWDSLQSFGEGESLEPPPVALLSLRPHRSSTSLPRSWIALLHEDAEADLDCSFHSCQEEIANS